MISKITGRQRQVVEMIAEGRSTKEIASAMDLSTRTVETYRVRLYRRFGVTHTICLLRAIYDFVPKENIL